MLLLLLVTRSCRNQPILERESDGPVVIIREGDRTSAVEERGTDQPLVMVIRKKDSASGFDGGPERSSGLETAGKCNSEEGMVCEGWLEERH